MNNYVQTKTETKTETTKPQKVLSNPILLEESTTVTTLPELPGVNPNEPISYFTVATPPLVVDQTIQELPLPPLVEQKETIQELPLPHQPSILEKARDTLYYAGETLGIAKPVEKARDTLYQAGETLIVKPVEKARDTLYQAGETLGLVKPVQNIEGPLAEIQDVRQDMGMSKMEQPVQKPLTEMAKESINYTSEKMEPYTEKAKETLYQAGEIMQQTGEKIGLIYPHQNIEGPLAEIQDVRQEMGLPKMEQPVQKSFAERAMDTFHVAGAIMEPYAEMAMDTYNGAKDTLHTVGEKIGLVYPHQKIEGPLSEIQDVRKDMGLPRMEQPVQKPLTERAKETWNLASETIQPYAETAKDTLYQASETIQPYTDMAKDTLYQASETIQPYTEKAKDSLYQAGETVGIVKPHQNIQGPLAEIQDVRQEMGMSKMEQPVRKPLTERAKETWNQASETLGPYAETAKDTLYQAGEAVGIVKPHQNIEGPLSEIQDVRQEMGFSKMEQPVRKPLTERAKETWNQASETIQPYAETAKDTLYQASETFQPYANKAKETWNQASEAVGPYTEKAKGTFYQAGEAVGLVKPAQNIEGPLAEIQDVRKDMGWSRMEQPVQKPLTERAKETWNQASETMGPYTEKARDTLYQAGEAVGIVKPHQNIEGPLSEIQDVRKDMGWSRMEQPVQKPLTERAKETWNQASETMGPYTEKARDTLYQAGEAVGIVKPHQNIEGPLAEIQDVRKDMGWSRMEQPVQKPLTERAKETWNQASETIGPYTELAKDTMYQAGEQFGLVNNTQNIGRPLVVENQEIRQNNSGFDEQKAMEVNERMAMFAERARQKMEKINGLANTGNVGPAGNVGVSLEHQSGYPTGQPGFANTGYAAGQPGFANTGYATGQAGFANTGYGAGQAGYNGIQNQAPGEIWESEKVRVTKVPENVVVTQTTKVHPA